MWSLGANTQLPVQMCLGTWVTWAPLGACVACEAGRRTEREALCDMHPSD